MVGKISGKNPEIRMLSDEPNLDYTASNQRLHEEINDLRITPMEKAIESLYKYYYDNRRLIDYDILKTTK